MATFRYIAKTDAGEEVIGVIDALTAVAALDALVGRGLTDVQVTRVREPIASPAVMSDSAEVAIVAELADVQPPQSLSSQEALDAARHIAQVSVARVPMAAGLRTAAEETDSRRVASALMWIADQMDQGRSLEDTLLHSGTMLPPYVSGLVLAAARTGTLGEALFDLVEQEQALRDLRRRVREGFAYPLFVAALSVCVLFLLLHFVTGPIGAMLEEFELKLPVATQMMLWWRDTGWMVLAGIALFALIAAAFVRVLAGKARWQYLLATMPMLGRLWHAIAISEWSGLMSVLLKQKIPLPEALRLAAHGMRNRYLADVSLKLADGAARGRPLSQMMFSFRALPSSFIPLVEWGEKHGALAESFDVGREMFAKRATVHAALVRFLVPPVMFLWIGGTVLFVVAATFAPMVNLISMLS